MKKDDLRDRVWDALEDRGVARFPFPPHGRIPNFQGAARAATRLSRTDAWERATTVKVNPDAPQRPVRRRALEAGKTIYMAVPRLRSEQCFLELRPNEISDIGEASTLGGASEWGKPVHPHSIEPVDLIVVGSVAVDTLGGRVGKGEGYSDLEYAILTTFDRVGPDTPVCTTVHELQCISERIPLADHDVAIDVIVTPERILRVQTCHGRPRGIDWDRVTSARRTEIPILQSMWEGREHT